MGTVCDKHAAYKRKKTFPEVLTGKVLSFTENVGTEGFEPPTLCL